MDIGKLKTTPVDLNKLVDIVKNQVVKKKVYDKLVIKAHAIQTIDTSNLVKKADYNIKIAEIGKTTPDLNHHKYITTQEFNKLTADTFASRLAKANLATKTDIADFVKGF